MAMNKKERTAMGNLELMIAKKTAEIQKAKSLSWPSYEKPQPLKVVVGGGLVQGWFYNVSATSYSGHWAVVSLGCSNGTFHSTTRSTSTNSQGHGRIFASRIDALKAARVELTEMCARELAKIDELIREEKTS